MNQEYLKQYPYKSTSIISTDVPIMVGVYVGDFSTSDANCCSLHMYVHRNFNDFVWIMAINEPETLIFTSCGGCVICYIIMFIPFCVVLPFSLNLTGEINSTFLGIIIMSVGIWCCSCMRIWCDNVSYLILGPYYVLSFDWFVGV